MGWSQLETLSGFVTQQSSSGTGQSGGSVPDGCYGPTGSAAPRGWSFLPLQNKPQYPFPVLGGSLKGDSSTSPDKPSHHAHEAIEKGQTINRRKGIGKGAPRRKAIPLQHIIQQLLFRNEVMLPYLQPHRSPGILLADIPHQPDLC